MADADTNIAKAATVRIRDFNIIKRYFLIVSSS
jgi:hypothetical protein